jgi:hypothetical protein
MADSYPVLVQDGPRFYVLLPAEKELVDLAHVSRKDPCSAIAAAVLRDTEGKWCTQCAGTAASRRWDPKVTVRADPCEACRGRRLREAML